MTGLSLIPAVAVEFIGSALVILLAFVALHYARALVKLQPNNFIWGFLWYFSIALAAFSLSRGVGHIVRIVLVYSDNSDLWDRLSPLSGGFNTMLMISVASVTIYYHRGLAAYKAIRSEAEKLADANLQLEANAGELQKLNTNLEGIVEDRTRDLSLSERKFRHFFENSKDIVYFSDLDGNITDINSSGLQILGLENSSGDLNFHQLFNNSEVLAAYLAAVRDKGFVSDLEVECIGRDGTVRHILLSANGIYDNNGELVGFEGIGKDMTRLRTITEQLINQEKMASVGEVAAGVAHEINTPLGIILGYAQLMLDDFDRDSEEYANMQVIERQTKACRRIVSDLLKFSRQSRSVKSSIDLNEIIKAVLSITEHTLNINKIKVERRFDPRLPLMYGDAEKLSQVFINLFTNAQHAMEEGGVLTVATGHGSGEIRVTVADTGTGIREEIKHKIFDPFFTTKEVGRGTGLGLAVTYGIVQEHGGAITVESPVGGGDPDGEQPGTAFHFRFPAEPDTAGATEQQE